MSLYTDYLAEIDARKEQGLNPKPIDDGALVEELIAQIERLESLADVTRLVDLTVG